jgi:rhamnopyranosyl-N-acetylglucosaminyl-diphospho-decaprenol beta-1,3/1,4-galactofuranosyltransferase
MRRIESVSVTMARPRELDWEHESDVVAPLILDIEDEQHLAFTYFVEGRRITTRSGMVGFPLVRHFAHLFNGTLVRAEAFARFGIPDYRLFLRGEEIDFLHRVRRGGGLIMTVTNGGFPSHGAAGGCRLGASPATPAAVRKSAPRN